MLRFPASPASPHLTCIAPPEFHPVLAEALTAAGLRSTCLARPWASPGGGRDPYHLDSLASSPAFTTDGLLLVAPRRRAPATVVSRPVIAGHPVGLLFADHPQELESWLAGLTTQSAGSPDWAVLAMWKDSYLAWGRKFYHWLTPHAPARVRTWFGNRLNRDDLCARLATGPRLAVYVGHGRPNGLSAYHGLRWSHLDAVPARAPCGAVLCLSCDTLNRFRGIRPFGVQWVQGGRAGAFFGSIEAVPTKANLALAALAGRAFQAGSIRTIGDLLVRMDALLAAAPAEQYARRGFDAYRLIGNPRQPL